MAETTHAHFDWNTYIELCERLVARVAKSGWQFDSLLCLARGGMRPGDFFSRIYGDYDHEFLPRSCRNCTGRS